MTVRWWGPDCSRDCCGMAKLRCLMAISGWDSGSFLGSGSFFGSCAGVMTTGSGVLVTSFDGRLTGSGVFIRSRWVVDPGIVSAPPFSAISFLGVLVSIFAGGLETESSCSCADGLFGFAILRLSTEPGVLFASSAGEGCDVSSSGSCVSSPSTAPSTSSFSSPFSRLILRCFRGLAALPEALGVVSAPSDKACAVRLFGRVALAGVFLGGVVSGS